MFQILVRERRPRCGVGSHAERSRADLIVATTAYQQLAIDRAHDHVLTVEDVFIPKPIAWRPRDEDHVRSILSTGVTFDRDVRGSLGWAAAWGVADRWRGALAGG